MARKILKAEVMKPGRSELLPYSQVIENVLVIDENTSFNDWQTIGRGLKTMENSIQLWIGDWLNFGYEKYEHGRYNVALKELGYEKDTLRQYSWVAEKSVTRVTDLSYTHHRIVAHLEPQMQKYWLGETEKRHLTVGELRKEIKDSDKTSISIPIDRSQEREILINEFKNLISGLVTDMKSLSQKIEKFIDFSNRIAEGYDDQDYELYEKAIQDWDLDKEKKKLTENLNSMFAELHWKKKLKRL